MKKYRVLCMVIACILGYIIAGKTAEAAEKAVKEEKTTKQVTIVEVPQNLNFYLDPDNEKGRGQIYSNKYRIRNGGKEEVTFSIEMLLSIIDAQADIEFCPEEWEGEPVDRSIYMYALFEGEQAEDKYILTDAEAPCECSVVLEPSGEDGDTVYISFGGMLSHSEDWKSGELAINSVYNMSSGSMGYTAVVEGEHIRMEYDRKRLESGKAAELSLVADEGYSLPAKIKVYMGGNETEASYDAVTGKILLENVDDNIVVYANGITKAVLPDAEVMNEEEALWSWTAQEGIQAYEYSFIYEDEAVKSGRVNVNDSSVSWNWSEGLKSGEYSLSLKAIGDAVHCLNSEEMSYQLRVDRELLDSLVEDENPERAEGSGESDEQEQPQPSGMTGSQEQTGDSGGSGNQAGSSEGSGNREQPEASDGSEKQEQLQTSGESESQE